MGDEEPLDHQIRFVLEADRLKTVLRQTTNTDGSRQENTAEHSWHLALMALALAEHAPPGTDLGRVTAMVVLHDLVRLRGLWEEFEERRTPEARFARALDRLQPMLLNMQTGGGTWTAHGVSLDQVLAKVALIEDGSASLGAYARQMIATAVARGFLAPDSAVGQKTAG